MTDYMINVLFLLLFICRQDILDEIVKLQNFQNQFLPNALRKFFKETIPPNERNDFLSNLVKKFSERFCTCNPQLNLSQGEHRQYSRLPRLHCDNSTFHSQNEALTRNPGCRACHPEHCYHV